MHISSLDIKSLTVFSHVLRSGNLSDAASQLGLTQPLVSQTLRRLRQYFDDELFFRTGHGMRPTARAIELADAVEEVLKVVREQIDAQAKFNPLTAKRTFTFMSTDFGVTVFLPRIVAELRIRAPGIHVRARSFGATTISEITASDDIDLLIGGFTDVSTNLFQQFLFKETYVCIAGKRFSTSEKKLTRSAFRNALHILVSPLPAGYQAVEQLLRAKLAADRIALELPGYLMLPLILPDSELLCTVPKRFADAMATTVGLQTLNLPYWLPSFDVKQYWHHRVHRDPAHQWFRSLIADIFQDKASEV